MAKKMTAHEKKIAEANNSPQKREISKAIATLRSRGWKPGVIRDTLGVSHVTYGHLARGFFNGSDELRAALKTMVAKNTTPADAKGRKGKTLVAVVTASTSGTPVAPAPAKGKRRLLIVDVDADEAKPAAVRAFRKVMAKQLDLFGGKVIDLSRARGARKGPRRAAKQTTERKAKRA